MAASSENYTAQIDNRIPLNSYNLDPGHVLYLYHSDNPNCSLSSDVLTGANYTQWKRSCEVSLSAKNKLLFN